MKAATLQRKCACASIAEPCLQCKKPMGFLQRKSEAGGQALSAEMPISVNQTLAEPGSVLEPGLRRWMESRFAHDFSQVRLHDGASATASAQAVYARAFTVGRHVVMGAQAPSVSTLDGRRLLAHELAHVVQQSRGGVSAGIDGSPALESAADTAADKVLQGRSAGVTGTARPGIAREPIGAPAAVYEVNFPDGKKRLTEAEFQSEKARIVQRLRIDLKRVAGLAENGRSSQVDMLKEYHGDVESGWDVVKKPKALIGIASDIWANTVPPHISMWSHPTSQSALGLTALEQGDLATAARMLRLADESYRSSMAQWNAYREKTIGGAESLATDLEHVRDISFAIALVAAAVLAAPVVAGGVAALATTTGVGGIAAGSLGATALTAGGTAVVTGAFGAALGGGSTALGSYSAHGKIDQRAVSRDAWALGKQGAVTGLTAGLGSALGGAGTAAQLGRPLVQQAIRRCATEAGINLTGAVTAEMLDRIAQSPEEAAAKKDAESKEVLSAPARAVLVGCVGGALGVPTSKLRSGTAKASDTGVGAGVSFADAKLQGKSNGEALSAAVQSSVTSHVVGVGKKNTDSKNARGPGAVPAEGGTAKPVLEGQESPTVRPKTSDGAGAQGHEQANSIRKEDATAQKPLPHGHEVVVSPQGVGVCSPPPCPVIHVQYRNELDANPQLEKEYAKVQALRESDPPRAATLAEALVRNLEQIRSNNMKSVKAPDFATAKQRLQIDDLVEGAQSLSGKMVKLDELNAHLASAKTPAELNAMIEAMKAQLENMGEGPRAFERRAKELTPDDDVHAIGPTTKNRTGRTSAERVLGAGMEAQGSAIPLDHDRHHVAPKRGGGTVGQKIRALLEIAGVSVNDPANGIPLAGHPRDARAVHGSSTPHNRAHTKRGWTSLLRDLETVKGDPDRTKAVLREHGQAIYEGRRSGDDPTGFHLGPNVDEIDED